MTEHNGHDDAMCDLQYVVERPSADGSEWDVWAAFKNEQDADGYTYLLNEEVTGRPPFRVKAVGTEYHPVH